MRVLVTGATGFVGAHVVRALRNQVEPVAVLVRPTSDRWRLASLLPALQVIEGDLRTLRNSPAAAAIASFEPEAVVHLAWEGVGGRYRNDSNQIEDNLASTLHLLTYCQQIGVGTWIGLGSQAEYGPAAEALDESAPTRPTTLYGATKLAVCTLAERLCALEGTRFAWLRLFSAYGPMDDPGWLVPSVIRSLLRRERPALTLGEQRWDYLYVEDLADAIVAVLQTASASGIYNVGSGTTCTIRAIVECLRDLIDPALPLGFGEIPYRSDQVMYLHATTTRLHAATGWAPRVSLVEGLARTLNWYRGVAAHDHSHAAPTSTSGVAKDSCG